MTDHDPIRVGEVFEGASKTLDEVHYLSFSALTGDADPIHYDRHYAARTRFGKPVAHGLLLASLTALGGSSGQRKCRGFIFVEQGCRFLRPAFVGDTVRPTLEVERLWEEGQRKFCRLKTKLVNQHGETLLEGFQIYRVLRGDQLARRPA